MVGFKKNQITLAVLAAVSGGTLALTPSVTLAATQTPGHYVSGDFHNHTTCSDGTISMQKLVKKATDKTDTPWGLDWFAQSGHGGNGNRNCTLVEDSTLATPAYPVVYNSSLVQQGPYTPWTATNPAVTPKGLVSNTSLTGATPSNLYALEGLTAPASGSYQNMWRWQSVQEIQYPLAEYLSAYKNLPLYVGVETIVPGHEHTSMSVINGQMPTGYDTATLPTTPGYTALGNATALAEWEYCFDNADGDTSRGNTTTTSGIGNN